jgi:hypothetical protein
VSFQLNDTHPTIAVPELMRVLMDDHRLGWTKAWEIASKVFAFTNHTVLPEALERWPVALFEKLLPRHMQIVYDINWRFLQEVRAKFGDDWERIARMSIIEEAPGGEKSVRMAYLACVASHAINGVAAIHSEIIKNTIFKDFYDLWPQKFQNKTNGVTQRRWLAFCNPRLRALITERLGGERWITHLDELTALRALADDPALQEEWRAVKAANKERAARKLRELTGVAVSTEALWDVQVCRRGGVDGGCGCGCDLSKAISYTNPKQQPLKPTNPTQPNPTHPNPNSKHQRSSASTSTSASCSTCSASCTATTRSSARRPPSARRWCRAPSSSAARPRRATRWPSASSSSSARWARRSTTTATWATC